MLNAHRVGKGDLHADGYSVSHDLVRLEPFAFSVTLISRVIRGLFASSK